MPDLRFVVFAARRKPPPTSWSRAARAGGRRKLSAVEGGRNASAILKLPRHEGRNSGVVVAELYRLCECFEQLCRTAILRCLPIWLHEYCATAVQTSSVWIREDIRFVQLVLGARAIRTGIPNLNKTLKSCCHGYYGMFDSIQGQNQNVATLYWHDWFLKAPD